MVKDYFVISDKQMFTLRKDLNISRRAAYAEGTLTNLRMQCETYILFCLYFKLVIVSSNSENLSLYAQFLSRSMKSIFSVYYE